jgi:type II secretory pathway component GspD/PulD (secretin)
MKQKTTIVLFVLTVFILPLFAQTPAKPAKASSKMASFEFINQPISDILYVFSSYAKISIIADTTVSGNATFQYNGSSFDNAFDSFLLANRLFVDKKAERWVVSRVHITKNGDGTINLDALDATPAQMLEKVTDATEATIIPDVLPSTKLSLHLKNATAEEAASLIIKPFSEYETVQEKGFIQIKRSLAAGQGSAQGLPPGQIIIDAVNDKFTVTISKARIGDVVRQLFAKAGKEYASFIKSDAMIDTLQFSDKSFEEALKLILQQGNANYQLSGDVWYLLPAQQSAILQDIENEGKEWREYDLKYRSLDEMLPLLQARFPSVTTISLSGASSLMAYADGKTATDVGNFIASLDTAVPSVPITLKYIRTEDLFKALPPSVKRNELVDTGNGRTVFFTGTKEQLAAFENDLKVIDRPATRIRYDLFIVQVDDTSGLNWDISETSSKLAPGDSNMVTGQLGNLLNLNFDVITVFGYKFAGLLNSAISKNEASVFADTTLYGLSGQSIKFNNTSTYRYRDYTVDPETGDPLYTGVTREIVSGLELTISGWASGDGMITMSISAALSKRGADTSSTTVGNPPPTSEKTLTTQVRARSGETIVLSGFRQNDSTIVEEKTPGLSSVPLFGWMFKSSQTSKENAQMLIYLVPHIDLYEDSGMSQDEQMQAMYEQLVVPYLQEKKES